MSERAAPDEPAAPDGRPTLSEQPTLPEQSTHDVHPTHDEPATHDQPMHDEPAAHEQEAQDDEATLPEKPRAEQPTSDDHASLHVQLTHNGRPTHDEPATHDQQMHDEPAAHEQDTLHVQPTHDEPVAHTERDPGTALGFAAPEVAGSPAAPAGRSGARLRPAAPVPGGARRARLTGPKVTYKRPSGTRQRGGSGKRIAILIFAFVVFVVVAGTAVVLSLRSGGAAVVASARTGGVVSASPVSFRYRTVLPARIGAWSKLDDQSPVEQFRTEVAQSGVQEPFAVIYTDPASNSAIAWGGVGTPYGRGTPDSRLASFFVTAGRNVGGGSAGPRTDVDPGPLDGKAQCATVAGAGISMVVCGWTGDRALLGFEFSAGTLDQDLPLMKSMLAAIVIPAANH